VVDEFGVPSAGELDPVGFNARPSDVGLTTTKLGEQQLETRPPISSLHGTPQSQLG
jgi:hypothetical protein